MSAIWRLCVGQLGVALIGRLLTAPLSWFPSDPSAEPFTPLEERVLARVTDHCTELIGRRRQPRDAAHVLYEQPGPAR
ncbi:hypothetical protein AB0M43_36340 [Longispora sp. NPDC051575]|uniref:hypothetical protein n=1 Tax=Longispora sp. NPDC051575 TaxID=3154943 RepID=UPI003441AD17